VLGGPWRLRYEVRLPLVDTSAPPETRPSSPVFLIGGRVVGGSVYRTREYPDLEDNGSWWTAASVFGVLVIGAGFLILLNAGASLAVTGVAFFLTSPVVMATRRFELSTAVGGAGFVWTTAGIGVSMGTLRNVPEVPFGFLLVGLAILAVSLYRRSLAVRRESSSLAALP
jgi:hypothetical protein